MNSTHLGSVRLTHEQLETIRTDGMVVSYIWPKAELVIVFREPARFGTPYGKAIALSEQELTGLAADVNLITEVPMYRSMELTEDVVDILGPMCADSR